MKFYEFLMTQIISIEDHCQKFDAKMGFDESDHTKKAKLKQQNWVQLLSRGVWRYQSSLYISMLPYCMLLIILEIIITTVHSLFYLS